ncbi:glycosyltransferase family 4 protein [Nocardia macrotermitis]|uniref:D-inositol-3-phosphate glycosyltransferase n=1 Tax=Nocardia macrotermitis TaxID=2585198 RepID=A0A7K0CYI3_9NOCA|nr:glycosyltransferase family 4 protein [Nocardia macrotermitis]MQY18546.1 D-inositol-3-phosphate glycosyltransferase [Nocardia macrotermitis]
MTGRPAVALAVHDGFYGCGTGAGYANFGFLDTMLSLLPAGVHLAILPVRLARGGPEHHPSWHARVRELLRGRDVSVHPIDNGTGGLDRWGGLDNFRTCGATAAECLVREVFPHHSPILTIAFDVPFFGLGALLPADPRRGLIIVPRSSGAIHDPRDTTRITWERDMLHTGSSAGARIGVISPYMRNHLRTDYGIPNSALLEFADGLCAQDWKRLTGSPGDDIALPEEFILTMGRAEPYKGFEDLLDAIAILHQRHCPTPHLIFAATTETTHPTEYQQYLTTRIEQLGIDATVIHRFTPAVSRILTHPGIRAVIVPSRAEPFGRIPMEAFAAAAGPVISTTAHGLSGQITDRVTGFTCAPADPDGLADALARALTLSPAERRTMIGRARTHARHRYDHTSVVRQVLAETAPWLVPAA